MNIISPLAVVIISHQFLLTHSTSSPTMTPTFTPSFSPSYTPSLPVPSYHPSYTPTKSDNLYIHPGAIAACTIFSFIGGVFVILMLTYLFSAPKGSSPGLFFFPQYYLKLYPGRDALVQKRAVVEMATSIHDKGDECSFSSSSHYFSFSLFLFHFFYLLSFSSFSLFFVFQFLWYFNVNCTVQYNYIFYNIWKNYMLIWSNLWPKTE